MSDPTPAAPAAVAPAPAADPAAAAVTPPPNLIADAKPAAEVTAPAVDPAAPAAEAKPGEEPKPTAVYADLKLPEGVKADDTLLTGFLKDAQESGLSKDQAQKLIDQYAGKLAPVADVKAALDANTKLWNDTQSKWRSEVESDPVVGGANLQANLAGIAKVIDSLGGERAPKIREAFNFTGAGNNPEIVRFLHSVSKTLAEGSLVTGGKPAAAAHIPIAERFYPAKPE